MTTVLLDACVPQWLRTELQEFDVETARYARVDQFSDDELLYAIEGRFDVLVTLDRTLVFQQKIAKRQICVIVVQVESQTPAAFKAIISDLKSAIRSCKPGLVQVVVR